jgi:hypothetical protein
VAFTDYPGRIYHGLTEQDKNGGSPIAVEQSAGGPTEREQAQRLGYLDSPDTYYGPRSFWWGYTGSSAHDAAQAVLADALGEQPDSEMIREFVLDVVSHLSDQSEWWLARSAVVRWARGYRAELDDHEDGQAHG